MSRSSNRRLRRPTRIAIAVSAIAAIAPASALAADPGNQAGWSTSVKNLTTGVVLGYEAEVDQTNHRLYVTDAQPAVTPAGGTTVKGTAKVVSLNSLNYAFVKNHSFANLLWVGNNPAAPTVGVAPTSQGTSEAPLALAVDGTTTNLAGDIDPTIVTGSTWTSGLTIYNASQSAPTDANVTHDSNYTSTVGTVTSLKLARPRTPVTDVSRHRVYMVNNGNATISVIDTQAKKVIANVPVVASPSGAALDVERNLLYVAGRNAATLTIVDLSKVKTTADTPTAASDPTVNQVAVTDTAPGGGNTIGSGGNNSRPIFDQSADLIYSANYSAKAISVIDGNPASPTYAQVLKSIPTVGSPNSLAIDEDRDLLYSADLNARVVSVIDTTIGEVVQSVPTSGPALDVTVDNSTGEAFASTLNSTAAGTSTALTQAFKVTRDADLPKGDAGAPGVAGTPGTAGPAGAPGVTGTPGATGPAGPTSTSTLSVSLSSLRVVGSKVSVKAPGAGTFKVRVTAAGKTIATGSATAKKAGTVQLTLKKTKYGAAKLKKKAISGTLTASFTPAKAASAAAQRSVKVTFAKTKVAKKR